jgi:hypothetical protein
MVSTSLMVDTSSHPRAQLHRCVERSAYKQSTLPLVETWIVAMTRGYAAPSRSGGAKDSAVSQGKKIQVSCDTSVMKVSTSGRPFGLA